MNGDDDGSADKSIRPGPERAVTTDDVLEVFLARVDRAEPLSAPEIADKLNVTRNTAHNRLQELVEDGVLQTKEFGARARAYWVPEHAVED